ncbi:MAG: guanylate kinase [Actinomycetota bacterium]|nr:guanylate kinase [Actinomycetota bacterium]
MSASAERSSQKLADPTGSSRLFVISGPSGAGKSSVVRLLREKRPFYFSVSATTRDPRPGEIHGVHYWFVDAADFAELIENQELLEWADYNGRRYGTLRTPVLSHLAQGEDVILEIEVQGARQVRNSYPGAVMFFILPPSVVELAQRLERRGDTSPAEITRRLGIAEQEIAEAEGLFDFLVVNEDLDRCVSEVLSFISPPGGGSTRRGRGALY